MIEITKPIFITGCARSGTSMTAGVLNICGAWGGTMHGATPNNKKGMFENRDIVNKMVKPFLCQIGADPMGQKPLPDTNRIPDNTYFIDEWRRRFIEIMAQHGYKGDHPLMYKGAKMCLMWQLWHNAFPDAQWVIVRRRSEDIINSCMRTGFMNKYDDREGWLFWVRAHVSLFRDMMMNRLNVVQLFPQEMIDGNYIEMEAIVKGLGLEWREQAVKEFITPDLWKGKKMSKKIKPTEEELDTIMNPDYYLGEDN